MFLKTKNKNYIISSGNIFEDLGFPNPEEWLAKAELAYQINTIIEQKGLTQVVAAKLLEIDQPKVSALSTGRLAGFSLERLFRFLNILDQDIIIKVTPKIRTKQKAAVKVNVPKKPTVVDSPHIEVIYREFYCSKTKIRHFIYLDNNLFNLLIKNESFWNNFFEFFHKEDQLLFRDIDFVFTWLQLLEIIGMGQVITTIRNSDSWKKEFDGKNKFKEKNIYSINNSLECYFFIAQRIVQEMVELQQTNLLTKINTTISDAGIHSQTLLTPTLHKAKKFVENNDYMDDLSYEIAWALLSSYDFIKSAKQFNSRKDYFIVLMKLWHELFLKGRDINFYRLADRQYSYTQYLGQLPKSFKHDPLKEMSDLCDGELIHYASFGFKKNKSKKRCSVIGITMRELEKKTFDTPERYAQRMAISKQTLIDLQRDVEGWSINPAPGEILYLVVENKEKIVEVERIPYNTPFQGNKND